MQSAYDALRLENQLCFPLYACSREVIRKYTPYLDELELTYTQYIVMMALWEYKKLHVKDLGNLLFLDSGTLTPLLKKLEKKGYVQRERCSEDARCVTVNATPEGIALRDKAKHIPAALGKCVDLSSEESQQLYSLLYKLLAKLEPQEPEPEGEE